MKIEFQGGECTLRIDLVERIIAFTERLFLLESSLFCAQIFSRWAKKSYRFLAGQMYL